MEEDLKVLEKELANIRNLIEYYTFESLDYDKKFRMERFEKAIKNLIKGYKDLEKNNNNVADRLEYYLIDNFAIMKNPNKVKEEFEKLLNMLQEGNE